MTQQHLHGNKFWDWQGWDIIKWIFAAMILFVVFVLIFAGISGQADEIFRQIVSSIKRPSV